MKRAYFVFLCVVIAVCMSPSLASAQTGLTWDAGQPAAPAGVKGRITGTGSISWDKKLYQFRSVTLVASNPKGGKGGEEPCTITMGQTAFSATIDGLPSGVAYDIYARMKVYVIGSGCPPQFTYFDTVMVQKTTN
jgi:hypothetical protein